MDSFLRYLHTTGDFIDPVTRLPLERDDIERIDIMKQKSNLTSFYPSMIELYDKKHNNNNNNNSNDKSNLIQRRQELQSMEACLGEIITDMLKLIEKKKLINEDLEYKMLVIFSEFEAPFQAYKLQNLEGSYHALQSWISFIKGPSRKPTKNNSGLLHQAISFLKGNICCKFV